VSRESIVSSDKPAHPVWRLTKIVAGLALFALGVIGLFLPILQGVLFMFLGLAILATENRHARDVVEALKRRHPGLWEKAEHLQARIAKALRRTREKPSPEEASGDEGTSRKTH